MSSRPLAPPSGGLPPPKAAAIEVADLIEEGVAVFNFDLIVTSWNREAERLYGWCRQEVIGGKIQAAVRCAPNETLPVILAKVHETGEWRGEFVRTTKSGALIVVRAKWSLRRDTSGSPVDIVETSRDISDIRRSEESFAQMRYQYQNLFQASVASFWELEFSEVASLLRTVSQTGITDFARYFAEHPEFVRQMLKAVKILDVNERTVLMFGKREEIVKSLEPFWPEESLPVFAESVLASIAHKPYFSSEAAFLSLSGERYETLFTVSFPPELRTSSKFLVGIIDITQSKRAREAQERSERRYRDFFNFMPIALFHTESGPTVLEQFRIARAAGVVDLNQHLLDHPELMPTLMDGQRITEVNQQTVQALLGQSAADVLGPVAPFWKDSPETFREIMAARYSKKKSFEAQTTLTTCIGSVIEVLFFVAFAPITGWEHVSLVALIDVSDRVKAQDMLAKLQADIAHAARVSVLGELTASIAHEVSQPLTAIEANTEASLLWLAHAEPNLAEVRELAGRTAVEVQRAAEILQRVRSMAVRANPVKAPVLLNPLIDEAILFLGHEITRLGIAIQIELDRGLPALIGDRVQLQQVVVNLAINAIQSMASRPEGSRVLTFRSFVTDHLSQALEVEDSGPGIAQDALGRLFEGFFTTKASGMGIGLAICRSIVEAHGGKIEARNLANGSGAVFTVELPLHPLH